MPCTLRLPLIVSEAFVVAPPNAGVVSGETALFAVSSARRLVLAGEPLPSGPNLPDPTLAATTTLRAIQARCPSTLPLWLGAIRSPYQ